LAPACVTRVSELRKSLQQERERAQALARDKAAALEKLATVTSAKVPDRFVPVRAESASADPVATIPAAPVADRPSVTETGSTAPDNPLLERAEALLRHGDVSGARLLLERASEDGDVRAILLLAQSFDPRTLSTLGVRGMRGDLAKAEELRARARSLQGAGSAQVTPPR